MQHKPSTAPRFHNARAGQALGRPLRPRWSDLGLACALTIGTWSMPARATPLITAWVGQVQVQAQTGPGCIAADEGRVWPVQLLLEERAAGTGGPTASISGLIWGDLLPASLQGQAWSALAIQWLSPVTQAAARSGHHASLRIDGDRLSGDWHETPPAADAGNSCFWTRASVSLTRQPAEAQAAAVAAGLRQRAFWNAAARAAAAPANQVPAALSQAAQQLLDAGEADAMTAAAWQQAADRLLMNGQRPLAREMTASMSIWLNQLAKGNALAAAGQALESGNSARLLRQWPLADSLYAQGLSVLAQHGQQRHATAAALLSARGTLMLRSKRVAEAQAVFEAALRVERQLTPGASEGVIIATHNLARACDAAGESGRAVLLLRGTLKELDDSQAATDPKLAALLREALDDIESRHPAASA